VQVNKSIDPITDQDQWGVIDQWDFPNQGRGDCEDYALLKRQKLIELGFPKISFVAHCCQGTEWRWSLGVNA